jgi:hypothetical protein
VRAHLAVREHRLLVLVHELDRVLDRDDVLAEGPVDVVDDRRERGRLARAGRARHEHQAFREIGELRDRGRQLELLGGEDLLGDDPEHRARAVLLHEIVGAEARHAGQAVGEVEVAGGLVLGPLLGGHDLAQERAQRRVGERGLPVDRIEISLRAQARRRARGEVQVGAGSLLQRNQQRIDGGHGISSRARPPQRPSRPRRGARRPRP